jgi:hypothetical protein
MRHRWRSGGWPRRPTPFIANCWPDWTRAALSIATRRMSRLKVAHNGLARVTMPPKLSFFLPIYDANVSFIQRATT